MVLPAEGYRPDIDGLRAVAVLAVVLYHARASLIPGGFVGVDIFFVISGFLISGIIFRRLDRGSFSLLDFYRRRVQRIAPAMFVVVTATLAAAYWLMLPSDSADVARSSMFSVGSLANVYFWLYQDQGYFAADTRQLPLLHLWSLGVEEQFYLVWPLVLVPLGRAWRSPVFLVSVAVAAIASFVLGDLLFTRDPSFVYYMMPTRAGELLVGALISVLVLRNAAPHVPAWLGPAGAGAIAASLFLYNDLTIFPGVRALLPTAGAAALILVGHGSGGPVTRLLGSRPFVAVGLISYSVYLWHWPLVAFYRYGYGELTTAAQIGLPAASLVLGAVSYALVEQPARALRFPPLATIVLGYGAPATAICLLCAVIAFGPRYGVAVHNATYLQQVEAVSDKMRPAFSFDYVCQFGRVTASDLQDPRCIVGTKGSDEPDVVLWGDSNAAHYIGVLGAAADSGGFRFRNIEVGSCPPVNADPAAWTSARVLDGCRESLAVIWPWVRSYQVVILGGLWTSYDQASPTFVPALEATIEALAERSMVVVLGKMPRAQGYDRRCFEKQLAFPLMSCAGPLLPLSADIAAVNSRLRAIADRHDRVEYFDMTPYLCTGGLCRSSGERDEPIYFDTEHISLPASWKLGEDIQRAHGMPPALAAVVDTLRHTDLKSRE